MSFKGGVTGIVGPNGCGKSNISDAIRWVLGEQSAKSLRGASMEDVIFNGSRAAQPAAAWPRSTSRSPGLNGNSPDGAPECVVTRRLYRNGESEYLMNGRICRLRDIHELFMDTGLGSQGLLDHRAGQDRPDPLEQAAATAARSSRRPPASRSTGPAGARPSSSSTPPQQNLLRVNDIVNEVEKQLESLKRQAAKARR